MFPESFDAAETCVAAKLRPLPDPVQPEPAPAKSKRTEVAKSYDDWQTLTRVLANHPDLRDALREACKQDGVFNFA